MLTPRLDAAIAAQEGAVDLAIVDIDDLAELAMEHNVNAVPTVVAIKEGKVVDRFAKPDDPETRPMPIVSTFLHFCIGGRAGWILHWFCMGCFAVCESGIGFYLAQICTYTECSCIPPSN